MSDELASEIRSAGVADIVTLAGYIGEDELPSYYQAADLFLLPTRDLECFGLPIIEAMACGCPSLVMPEGGPAEVCKSRPDWVARANTGEAFTELVRGHLDGEHPRPTGIEQEARRLYSNDAIRPQVVDLVESLHRGD